MIHRLRKAFLLLVKLADGKLRHAGHFNEHIVESGFSKSIGKAGNGFYPR